MKQFDNYELTTLDYTLKYYLEHNELLDDDDIEWCNLVREKIDSFMISNIEVRKWVKTWPVKKNFYSSYHSYGHYTGEQESYLS